MNAVKAKKYGEPEVLEIMEVPEPEMKEDQVLVKIHKAAVTPTDINYQTGKPAVARLFSGILKPKGISGDVFSGEIIKIGENVSNFLVGDKVFGTLAPKTGTHAEFVSVKSTSVISKLPNNLSFSEAASLVDGPLTANAFLQKIAKVKPGQSILVNGASGSVGSAAIQLAKHFKTEVTGVCSGKNVKFVQKLGADKVIDYTNQDFTKSDESYDIIFDAVYKSSFTKCKHLLKPRGIYMTTGPSLDIFLSYIKTRFTKKKGVMGATGPFWKQPELEFIRDLAEQEVLVPTIDRTFPFEEVSDAFAYVATGRKVGSVILDIAD